MDLAVRLRELGLGTVRSQVEGRESDRHFVVTADELALILEDEVQRVDLRDITKISSDGSGTLRVFAGDRVAISTASKGFRSQNLKDFFIGVKNAVGHARLTASAFNLPAVGSSGFDLPAVPLSMPSETVPVSVGTPSRTVTPLGAPSSGAAREAVAVSEPPAPSPSASVAPTPPQSEVPMPTLTPRYVAGGSPLSDPPPSGAPAAAPSAVSAPASAPPTVISTAPPSSAPTPSAPKTANIEVRRLRLQVEARAGTVRLLGTLALVCGAIGGAMLFSVQLMACVFVLLFACAAGLGLLLTAEGLATLARALEGGEA